MHLAIFSELKSLLGLTLCSVIRSDISEFVMKEVPWAYILLNELVGDYCLSFFYDDKGTYILNPFVYLSRLI